MKTINRTRINQLVKAVQTNSVIRDFVQHKTFNIEKGNQEETNDALGYLLELVITHMTECVDCINDYESVYSNWYNNLIDFDKLAKEVQKQENNTEKTIKILKILGYIKTENE